MRYKIIAAAAGVLLFVPIGWQAGGAIGAIIADHASLVALIGGGLMVAAALAGLHILFGIGRHTHARARIAELATLQNGQPIHIDDVSLLSQSLIADLLRAHAEAEKIRAAVSPTLTHFHQEIHPTLPATPSIVTLTPEPPPQLAGPLPDLAQAIRQGWSAADRWLVGLDAGGNAQTAALKHTGMIAVSGVPGTGKTSAAAWLAAQTAAHGGVLYIADPHYGDAESLSARIEPFAGAVEQFATTADQINALILQVAKIYDQRCARPDQGGLPVLLLIDEFMELMLRKQLSDEAERALVVLSGGGRKKELFGCLISQNWSAVALGQKATVLRQIVTGSLVHQSDAETAKFLLPPRYATAAATLQPGEALWFGSGTPIQVRVPYLSPTDARLAAQPHPQQRSHHMAGMATPPSSAALPIAPTERVAPQPPATPTPPRAAPETARLQLTVKDQIILLLDARIGQWLTHSEIAAAIGVGVDVVTTEAKNLYDNGLVSRRACRRGNERVEYTANQFATPRSTRQYASTA